MSTIVPPILVLGVGNPLMADEGVGPRIVEFLREGYCFPESVEVDDAGTMGFMIIDLLREREHVLILDATQNTGLDPGTVLRLTPDEIAPNAVMHSMHDLRIIDVLQAAALLGAEPDVACVGVQIDNMAEWVTELTPAVEAAIPMAAAVALDILAEWGATPQVREHSDASAQVLRAIRTYERIPTHGAEQAED